MLQDFVRRNFADSKRLALGRWCATALLSLGVAGLVSGCQSAGPVVGSGTFGTVAQITGISPDTTQVLRAGERIRLKVDVAYALTAETGSIELIVLADDNSSVAKDVKAVTKGRGTATLQAEFLVPGTTAIRVFVPLVVQGPNAAFMVDGRAFQVRP